MTSEPIILWCGRFSKSDGYGTVSRNHLRGLVDESARVAALDTDVLRLVGPETGAGLQISGTRDQVVIQPKDADDRMVVVFHERPDHFERVRVDGRARLIGHTVFETESLPPGWAAPMVSMDEIWAATEFNRQTFVTAGIPAFMIDKVPHSLDSKLYQSDIGALRFGAADEVVFLTVCSSLDRRDLGLAFRSFLRAFSHDDAVRYVVKLRDDLGTLAHARAMLDAAVLAVGGDAPLLAERVEFVAAHFGDEEMVRLLRGCDVYVSVERANGWDLPTMEAMACGKLTIGYDTGGSTEFTNPDVASRLPTTDGRTTIPISEPHPFYSAQWWPVVNEDLMVEAMGKAVEPEFRAVVGARAAEHVASNFDISVVGRHIMNLAGSYGSADFRSNGLAKVIIGREPRWRSAGTNQADMVEDLLTGLLFDAVSSPFQVRRVMDRYRNANDLRNSVRRDATGPVASALASAVVTPSTRAIAKVRSGVQLARVVGRRAVGSDERSRITTISRAIREIQTAEYDPNRIYTDDDLDARRLAFGRHPLIPLSSHEQSELRSMRDRYRGERCFVIGNGPSLNDTDLSKLEGEYTFGVNKIFLLYDRISWRPTFYTLLDWRVGPEIAPSAGLLSDSIKFFPNRFRGVLPVDDRTYWYTTRPVLDHIDDQFRADIVDGIPSKGTIVMTAIQLAFYLGFRDINLIGTDASYSIPETVRQSGPDRFGTGIKLNLESTADDDPNHFDPTYFGAGAKWHDPNVDEMRRQFRNMRKGVEFHGGRIRNATVGGQLEVFERVDYESLF